MSTKNQKKAATLAAVIGTIAATYALAVSPSMYLAVWQNDPGGVGVCHVGNDKHLGPGNGEEEIWEHAGQVEFVWTENSEPGGLGPKWSHMQAQSVEFDGNSPTYGAYHVSLDDSRPLTSSIEALGEDDFPAVSTMRFHATLTFDSQPGVEYRTTDASPIVMRNSNLDHWPHDNTPYTQVGSTEFVNADDPDAASITLHGASLTTTAE